MSESKKRLTESVSALVDGEVSELELHRILKELELETANHSEHNDQGIAGKWSRYNLISQAMVNTPLGSKDISKSITDAIAQEKTHKTNFLQEFIQARSVGSFAVAACVAVMAIVGVQQLNSLNPLQNSTLPAAMTASNSAEQLQRPANQFPVGFQPNLEARTVNAGGVIKTSQPSIKLIKLFTNNESQKSHLDLPSTTVEDQKPSESNNSSQDDMPNNVQIPSRSE